MSAPGLTTWPAPPGPVAAPVRVLRAAEEDGTGRLTAATAVTVGADEPVLPGHYPHFPIFPGVCVIECVHLSGLRAAPPAAGRLRLAGVESARFLSPVFPGDDLDVHLTWTGGPDTWRCAAKVTSPRGAAAQVRLRFAAGAQDAASAADMTPAQDIPSGKEVTIGQDGIRRILPHRYPMLLLDRVTGLVPDRRITAVKAVTCNEPWYGRPGPAAGDAPAPGSDEAAAWAYPPVLLAESWCQAAGLLAIWDPDGRDVLAGRVMLFGGISDVEYLAPVLPGDVVEHRAAVSRMLGDTVIFQGTSVVDGRPVMRVASAVLAFRPAGQLRADGAEGAGRADD